MGSSRKITRGEPIERHRQVEAAAHPARVRRHLPGRRVREIEPLEKLVDARAAGGAAEMVQIGHQLQVLLAGQQLVHRRELAGDTDRRADAVRVGDDVVAGHLRVAGVGGNERGEDPHDRRLARSVRAEQREDRSLGHGEIDAVEHGCLAERLPHAGQDDGGLV